ncbi:hypothetical protein F5Y15DRAFT_177092 [Xylariaceae sp. FL0016]|nr:hypothetical protein F5Y15DRAFT_177092 [Xylariaceae sp. FL0016]
MAYKLPPSEPIAIVGSSCRFAGGATSPAQLWDLLREAPDLSRDVPEQRFSKKGFYHPDGEYHGTTNSIKAYWLDQDHRVFDASFFNITPKEAEAIDPQQRLLLEVVYEAMESAGFTLGQYSGKDVGVYSGCMTGDYDTLSQRDELFTSQYYATGNSRAIISNRVSYFFNFQGPSLTVDTACSSSLVALHEAILALRAKHCAMACVTGVNLMITPEQFIVESTLHMLSPTGKSRMWDAGADGYARGEGIAALFLKPLSQALADGDHIDAIIREVGVNSDGKTRGITMPNSAAQAALINKTYTNAGLDPKNPLDRCQYFEAHGTGTQAGDPREAAAIDEAFFGANADKDESDAASAGKMLVGSVKTVIGHTEGTYPIYSLLALTYQHYTHNTHTPNSSLTNKIPSPIGAAGLAGLLKAVGGLKHGQVFPNLHLENLNPTVKPYYTHLEIPTSVVDWPEPPTGQPRRASVNSFGFGGTNAHAIVEQYIPAIHDKLVQHDHAVVTDGTQPSQPKSQLETGEQPEFFLPLTISAASQKSLQDRVASYNDHLTEESGDAHELSWQLYNNKTHLPYRISISVSNSDQVKKGLDQIFGKISTATPIGTRAKAMSEPLKALGIFTGQGAQWATMSKALFLTNDVYRETIRGLDQVLADSPDPPTWTLEQQILATGDASLVGEAAVSQPLCTAVQLGLVDVMKNLGVGFHTVIGHSSGEIAAAYAAGRLTARDAILISFYRGKFAYLAGGAQGQKGGMLAAGMSETDALAFCKDPMFDGGICVAASNAPSSVTLAGDYDMIILARDVLSTQNKFARLLKVDTAYHSPHMVKPSAEYVKALQECDVTPIAEGNETVWVSSVYGYPRTGERDLGCGYWKDNMVNAVQFHDAVHHALSEYGPYDVGIEIGPHTALKGPVQQTAKSRGDAELRYSGPLDRQKDDSLAFSDFLGFLWSNFSSPEFDFGNYVRHSPKPDIIHSRLQDLPAYPFDHSAIHYRESRVSKQYHFKDQAPHELLGVRTRDDNEHLMRWRNILKLDKIPWLEGHSFQNQPLLPASAYCVMALDAAQFMLNGRPASVIELRDLDIKSGISVERESSGTEIMFSLQVLSEAPTDKAGEVIEAFISLTSCNADGSTTMKQDATAHLTIMLGEPSGDALPPRDPCLSETLSASPSAFYKMMDNTGLVYSGPFRSLTSIQRRYNYCAATLLRSHPEDTTLLQVSPATLDSCFQSAFLSYASPGDRSLWTSFLPIKIDSVRFNLAAIQANSAKENATLSVDTHMISTQHASPEKKATFVVDMGIFGESGEAEVHVEGLTVRAVANTLPKDDHELYLHTIMDMDPTDEIIGVEPDGSRSQDRQLIKDCKRVASFVTRDLYNANEVIECFPECFPETNRWTWDNADDIDGLISRSLDQASLEFMRVSGHKDAGLLRKEVSMTIEQARCISAFHKHVARIVKQITHKHPRTRILGFAGADSGFMKQVMNVDDLSFLTMIIASDSDTSAESQTRQLGTSRKNVKTLALNAKADLKAQMQTDSLQDIVLLSSSMVVNDQDVSGVLKNIRSVMKPDGYLILVHNSNLLLANRDNNSSTPPIWPDVLESYGFYQRARNSDQFHQSGFIMVRQSASSPATDGIKRPSLGKVLLIGSADQGRDSKMVNDLQSKVSALASEVTVQDLDLINEKDLAGCKSAIVMADLAEPLMSNMTEHRLNQLRMLLQPEMTVLWLTHDSLYKNPEHAATLGFARTVVAEIPNLRVQLLDLEDMESSATLITSTFGKLVTADPTSISKEMPQLSYEPEIHMENGKQIIARIVPYKPANDSANAMRRVVTRDIGVLEEPVEIEAHKLSEDMIRYEAKLSGLDLCNTHVGSSHVLIQVIYSTVQPFYRQIAATRPAVYICLGLKVSTGEQVIALSEKNASYLLCPFEDVYSLPDKALAANPLVTIHFAMRWAIAFHNSEICIKKKRDAVLINPEPWFVELWQGLVKDACKTTIYSTAVNPGIDGAKYIHPRAATRDINGIFPIKSDSLVDDQTEAIIFNLLSEESNLSRQIRALCPSHCSYRTRASIWSPQMQCAGHDFLTRATLKDPTILQQLQGENYRGNNFMALKSVTLSELLSSFTSPAQFPVIDWRAEQNTVKSIDHLPEKNLLRPNETYILFGLTRDLGQSLCRLFVQHGAKHMVLSSRNPNTDLKWVQELLRTHGARILIEKADVTSIESLQALKAKLLDMKMPPAGGIINGAMVLDDRVFAQMTVDVWNRVLRPKTVGSKNLDIVFNDSNLRFFIMTSSFAATGGHPGQSNYAAANMYMNGLAADRRRRGLAGSALNIGVIYGLGFLQREKDHLYAGLEREGYPPISERDLHHMFLSAIVAGRPNNPNTPFDLTTGLSRFQPGETNPLHWHLDPRFNHFTVAEEDADELLSGVETRKTLRDIVAGLSDTEAVAEAVFEAFTERLEALLAMPRGGVNKDDSMGQLGVDSLVAVEIRNWIWKTAGKDVSVIKVLGAMSIYKLCLELAEQMLAEREVDKEEAPAS